MQFLVLALDKTLKICFFFSLNIPTSSVKKKMYMRKREMTIYLLEKSEGKERMI